MINPTTIQQKMKLNILNLSFQGPNTELEGNFKEVYTRQSLRQLHWVFFISLIFYLGCSWIDFLVIPDQFVYFGSIRAIVVALVAIISVAIDRIQHLHKYSHWGVGLNFLVVSVAGTLMASKPTATGIWYYGATFILLCFIVHGATRIRFIWATVIGWIMFAMYCICAISLHLFDQRSMVGFLYLLIGSNLLGMIASYSMEYYARREFYMAYLLRQEEEKVKTINQTLEERILARTNELVKLNDDLKWEITERLKAEEELEQNRFNLEIRVNDRTKELERANRDLLLEIGERQRIEARLEHLATHDPLTDLPNRSLLEDRLKHALSRARRSQQSMALFFLDLDGFKPVNDAFGHRIGDLLLQTLSRRLRNCLRESDTIARIGGDEFAILLEGIADAEDAASIAEKILFTISQPFQFVNEETQSEAFITGSIGISIYPGSSHTPQTMLQNADAAMYSAKEKGKNNYAFYTAEIGSKMVRRLDLTNQLRHAIDRNEFVLHYQPQVDATSGEILGVEALIRWNHPVAGLVPPGEFIPLAEECGLIIPIGEWVLQQACTQSTLWQKSGLPGVRMAVNLSSRQVEYKNLVRSVKSILDKTGLDPSLLELELTENTVFQNADLALNWLLELKALGVRLALDDFGTGYSSLSYLTRFPFDIIKIDLAFVRAVTKDPGVVAIVTGIIAIANSLNKEIIVEGIDTMEQLDFFQSHGCNRVQGWYFSPAVPSERLAVLLEHGFEELAVPI